MRIGYAWDGRWEMARVNAEEAARLTGYTRSHIYHLMYAGKLPHIQYRIPLSVLMQLPTRDKRGRKRKNG